MKSLERMPKEGECDTVADAFTAACDDGDFTFLCWDVTFNVELMLAQVWQESGLRGPCFLRWYS